MTRTGTVDPQNRPTRWELRACGRQGHATYRPDEPELAARLSGTTGVGQVWRCLRCGGFALGEPAGSGPAAAAPLVLRGKALRSALVLRALAVERTIRGLLIGLAAYGVLRFSSSTAGVRANLDRWLPALQQAGIRPETIPLVPALEHAARTDPGRLALIAGLLAVYAAVELVEAVGLWLLSRWGEYFAVVATGAFLPLEIHELLKGATVTKAGAFVLNVAAVVYLLVSKRLFGVRGGFAAYDRERRGEQLLDVEIAAGVRPESDRD